MLDPSGWPDNASQYVTFGGSAASCGSAPFAYLNESTVLFIISALGAFVGLVGLFWSIWDSNRKFKLMQEQSKIQREGLKREREQHTHSESRSESLRSLWDHSSEDSGPNG